MRSTSPLTWYRVPLRWDSVSSVEFHLDVVFRSLAVWALEMRPPRVPVSFCVAALSFPQILSHSVAMGTNRTAAEFWLLEVLLSSSTTKRAMRVSC
jgi:hypothetical protein